MPNPVEQELGLGPVMYGIRRWIRGILAKLGLGGIGRGKPLDPLTVNYEAWRAVRSNVREWPHYQEAPNCVEVLVSRDDWDDYWGVDALRKEAGVSSYVRAQAIERGLWISGDPQVSVRPDDTLELGEVEVRCQFAEPAEPAENIEAGLTGDLGRQDMSSYAETSQAGDAGQLAGSVEKRGEQAVANDAGLADDADAAGSVPPFLSEQNGLTRDLSAATDSDPDSSAVATDPDTLRFIHDDEAAYQMAYLVGEGVFRLAVCPGDCIGAVREGDDVPEEVNIRLDASAFPYVEPRHFSLGIHGGGWAITNYATCGTKLVTRDGARYMLREEEPFALGEGDVVWLGPDRPVRFELA